MRKTGNGKWSVIANYVTTTAYTDTTAINGSTYKYTVAASNEAGLSKYNTTGLSVKKLAIPAKITVSNAKTGITVKCLGIPAVKLSNASNGVKISWGKVAGASKYRVYRKGPGETKWTTLKDTTSLSFTDTKASAGKKYTYTVKAISGKSISSCASKTILRLKNPTLKSASKTTDGVKVTWGGVAGAESYYVYRKTANSGWTKITETSNKSYIDTTAKKGTTYIYTVRAANGSTLSSYNSTGLKIKG
jgi:fibronectin type 3 domain-containing protein